MNGWAPMRGRLGRLQARNLETQVVEEIRSLLLHFFVRGSTGAKELARHGEAFAKDQVGRRSSYVRFDCRSDRQQGARELPKPLIGRFGAKCGEGLFQPSVQSFDEPVGFGVVRRR